MFFESLSGFVFDVLFWFVIVVVGILIIAKPKLLYLIPLYIIQGIVVLFVGLLIKGMDFIVGLSLKAEVNLFEKYINNVGIKYNIDVGACHSYFNQISSEKISLLFEIYFCKALNELKSGYYDEEQLERYIHLLEIMNRCLVFKQEKSPY